MGTLVVRIDGVAMNEADARAFWERFSAHMEAHKGDLAGFARAEGFASVRPTVGVAGPELVVSCSATQTPYRNAEAEKNRSSRGSSASRGAAPKSVRPDGNRGKKGRS